jgi:hypothetical protein
MNAETAGEQKWLRQKILSPRKSLDVHQVKIFSWHLRKQRFNGQIRKKNARWFLAALGESCLRSLFPSGEDVVDDF